MRYSSGSTKTADPYRAGVDLGQKLQPTSPEVVLVFCTIHYVDSIHDLSAGIRDVLGDKVLVCGGTGDGIYETGGVANHGASALGIDTEGESQWRAELFRGVHADSAGVAERAVNQMREKIGAPISLAFALADGLKADGAWLTAGLRKALNAPCFGGLTADDRQFSRSVVFVGEEEAEDALMLLVATGRVPIWLNCASGWRPVGEIGRVTRVEGAVLHEIDGFPAEKFLREQTGKTMGGMELAVLPIAEYLADDDSHFALRSCSHLEGNGAVTLFGRVMPGSRVRVCHASMEEIVGGVETALVGAKNSGFEAAAAIIVSCAGRKWLLAEDGQEEVNRTIATLGSIPLIGMPSFGEICPFRSKDGVHSPALFHNVTFVAGVLGR
jgi:hypothetical protein